jgi:hypothetical protein
MIPECPREKVTYLRMETLRLKEMQNLGMKLSL